MITKATGYQSSDGTFHTSLVDAQTHEVENVICKALNAAELTADENQIGAMSKNVMAHSSVLVDILTMKPNSLPKARRINGGTKKREKKHIAEQFAMPLGSDGPGKEAV